MGHSASAGRRDRVVRWAAVILLAGLPAVASAQENAGPQPTRSLLGLIWEGMEWPAWFILAGSLVAIALIVEHFLTIRASTVSTPELVQRARQLIEARSFRECLETMRRNPTFFARIMSAALQHARHGFEAMHEAALEKSGELSGRMYRKIEYLNILGNLGPLMGLLGTVLGMIYAFNALGTTGGGADAGQLARGISLALVNTLLGLALAVVGLGFFGVCRNRIESLTVAATVDALDLLEYFRPAGATTGPATGPPAAHDVRRAPASAPPRPMTPTPTPAAEQPARA